MPGAFKTGRPLTNSSPAQTCAFGGLSSSINTAKASLSWSRLRAVSARRNRQVETHSDLVSGLEAGEVDEVVIAVVRRERNQEQQGASGKG